MIVVDGVGQVCRVDCSDESVEVWWRKWRKSNKNIFQGHELSRQRSGSGPENLRHAYLLLCGTCVFAERATLWSLSLCTVITFHGTVITLHGTIVTYGACL